MGRGLGGKAEKRGTFGELRREGDGATWSTERPVARRLSISLAEQGSVKVGGKLE